MADYWKSQPKKFCDYCKCWIADNRPSIEFHERGKNHKENVAKRISEIKKKSLEKAQEEEKMSKEFAAMEEAALKAYEEDLKRLGVKPESIGHSSTQTKQVEKKEKKEKKKKKGVTSKMSSGETKEWVRGFSPEGYTYYYNTITGESQWEKPEGFQDNPQNSQMTAVWVEGVTEDGHTYYYNTQTGVSKWEKPEGFVSSLNESRQDDIRSKALTAAASKVAESHTEKGGKKSEVQKPKINFKHISSNAPGYRKQENLPSNPSGLDVVKNVYGVQRRRLVSPLHFPQRKGDSIEETEEETPPKAKKISPYGKWQNVKQGGEEEEEEEEEEEDDSTSVLQKTSHSLSKKTNPYGDWETVAKEEVSYEKVDLELPSMDSDRLPPPVLEVPEDAKVIFKEKIVTSLGDLTEGMSTFRKRKFENGKSRNLRQRTNDQ